MVTSPHAHLMSPYLIVVEAVDGIVDGEAKNQLVTASALIRVLHLLRLLLRGECGVGLECSEAVKMQ